MSSSLIEESARSRPDPVRAAPKSAGLPWRLPRRWPVVWGAASGLLLWTTVLDFRLENPPPKSLDGSWVQALGYCCTHHFQAGVDYVFTCGPLGYFLYGAYDADLFWYKFGWELGIKLAFTLTFWQLLVAYPSWTARLTAFVTLWLSTRLILGTPDTHCMFFILVQGVLLIRSRGQPFGAARLAGIALITLLAFTKFTFFLLALCTLVIVVLTDIAAGRRLKALQPLLAFAGLFVLGWCALGQSVANLPPFVYGSLQVSAGYTEAMALPGDKSEVFTALGILVLLAIVLVSRRPAEYLRPGRLPAAFLIGLGLFLEWKHGFIRQDQHAFGFFGLAFLTPLLFPVAFPTDRWQSVPRGLVLGTVGLLAGVGMIRDLQNHSLDYPQSARQCLEASWQAVRTNCQTVLNPARLRAALDRQQAQLEAAYQLPRIKKMVGNAPVDVFSFEQGVLFRNRLNWRPRPIFQSYSAYTPYLIRTNADFYAGARAPEFVMYKIQPGDNRLPMLEDGPALLYLLSRYRPVLVERAYVLLQRTAASAPPITRRLMRARVIRLNEEVPLEDAAGALQWLSLDLRPSLEGKIWSFLYKPNLLYIRLKTEDGQTLLYRFIPNMARTGFLLNPLILTNTDLIGLYGSSPGRRVVSFCILARPRGPSCYRPEVRMTLESLPEPRTQLSADEIQRLLFPSFQTYPTAVGSSTVVRIAENAGQDVVLVHPEGYMQFAVAPGAGRFRAHYGIVAEAYETGWTEGVLFVVEYHPATGPPRVLFQRSLEPRTRPDDRGPQGLDLPLPAAAPGTLVLKTRAIPGKSIDCGWSYWSDVRIN